ncbi:hypothetical protein Ahia01_000737200, partial [Argonauta hians]
ENFEMENKTQISTSFHCDYPECSLIFSSRQVLNSHMRIHGKSVTCSRAEPVAATVTSQLSSAANSVTTNSAATTNTVPAVEYPCKLCGKVFAKIKSRCAHMKSHAEIVRKGAKLQATSEE